MKICLVGTETFHADRHDEVNTRSSKFRNCASNMILCAQQLSTRRIFLSTQRKILNEE